MAVIYQLYYNLPWPDIFNCSHSFTGFYVLVIRGQKQTRIWTFIKYILFHHLKWTYHLHVWGSVCSYLLTAQQTATAPRDAPWLLQTETAQWPGAKTQKSYGQTHKLQTDTFTQAYTYSMQTLASDNNLHCKLPLQHINGTLPIYFKFTFPNWYY